MSDYDGINRTIRSARETLQTHVGTAIEEFLKRELGIWLTTKQLEKLIDWIEQERVA